MNIEEDVQSLANKLTNAGFEVESIDPLCTAKGLVVGEILECHAHPDSDHLHVCLVNIGEQKLTIVCGAPNVAKDQKVIVAPIGTILPKLMIKKSIIRGVESVGMICSLLELGVDKRQLSNEQLIGIEVLENNAVVGDDPLISLGLDDVILDVSVTPNRADCNSMFNFVREIGAILNLKVILPTISDDLGEKTDLVINSTTTKCPLFLGKIIRGVSIADSPSWLKVILSAYGIKSINNIVDISNLVMLETGQPLHFYDLDKLPASELTCANDYEGEYLALDGIKYPLLKGDLVIKSGGQVVGIAGIMGGDNTKITETTKNILIESANFDLASIRLTSRRLNIQSEAASRFSKGISKYNTTIAITRAVNLLSDLANVRVCEKQVVFGDTRQSPNLVTLTVDKCNVILNSDFTKSEIASVFDRLGFRYTENHGDFEITIPLYRLDIELPEDLIEEIVRILGFQRVISKLPTMYTTIGSYAENQRNRKMIKVILNGLGLTEVINYSLVSQLLINDGCLPLGNPIELSNPLSEQRKYYRNSLLPSMLETISYNQAHFQNNYAFFEVGNVYGNLGEKQERLSLGISNQINLSRWQKLAMAGDFYVMKGRIEAVLVEFGFDQKRINYQLNDVDNINFHPQQGAKVFIDKTLVGVFGRIHPKQMANYSIANCVIGELNLSGIYNLNPGKIKYKVVSKFPSLVFDLSMIVAEEITAKQIIDCVTKSGKDYLIDIDIFDIFKGGIINKGSKSVAITMTFQSSVKTLQETDINPVINNIVSSLQNQLKATIRDK